MNRIARILCAASLFGAVSVAPSMANAQTVNVAPPAYTASMVQSRRDDGDRYEAVHDDRYRWERDRDQDRWARANRKHARVCERAFEERAPRWILERMGCLSY